MNQISTSNNTTSGKLFPASWRDATGPLAFTLTNDCLFKNILQKKENQYILRALLASLLHLSEEDITSIEITNPIMPGDNVTDKTFILDIRIILNGSDLINLEMQVIDYGNWPERSLGYLCRSFDNLNRGDDYIQTKPATLISILDFTLFEDAPEFYSTYRLTNQNNGKIYTDKFTINVLDLTKIELATDEDTDYSLDYWAKIFKAKTWEDLRMIATAYDNKESFTEDLITTIYDATSDEAIRLQCEAREDFLIHERVTKQLLQELNDENSKLNSENTKLNSENTKLNSENTKLNSENTKLNDENAKLRQQLIDAGITPNN